MGAELVKWMGKGGKVDMQWSDGECRLSM